MSKRAARAVPRTTTLPLDPFAGITQTPDDYVAPALGDDRHAARARAPQHAQGARRAGPGRRGARRPDARPRSVAARHRASAWSRDARISFFPRGDSMGVVLPNNSPGVHSLWAPTTVLKIPLVLKPGSAEPWTPYPHDPGVARARAARPRRSASIRAITPAATRSCAAPAAAWCSATSRRPSAGARKAAASRSTVRASAR